MTADGQRSSLLGAFFNLATTTLGAGILTLPFFYSQVNSRRGSEMPTCAEASWLQAGILLGSGFIVFIASLSAFSLHLLLACQRKTLRSSYMEVAHAAFGEPGRVVRIRFSSCGCEYCMADVRVSHANTTRLRARNSALGLTRGTGADHCRWCNVR